MEIENQFAVMASLIGDKCRSLMLWNLLDGRAYTATELSLCADISAQSASNHLSKLVYANILSVEKQGRHRYYRYANHEAASVIESLTSLLAIQDNANKEKSEPSGLKYARTCYDHLAGKLGVKITEALINKGVIKTADRQYEVSSFGISWFNSLGINVDEIKLQKRSFAHSCLDWSERRYHLAGALGASLLQMMLKEHWIKKGKNSREIFITSQGKKELQRLHVEL